MRSFKILNRLGSFRNISVAGSLLSPLVDNRLVPYPWIMMFVVTRRCNARCQMCSIWQEKDSPFLSLEQIEGIFTRNDFSFVRSLAITGGEPTLRSDLPQIFELNLRHMQGLEHVLMATSGLNTRRTLEYTAEMMELLSKIENKIYRFDVQISLDGIGAVHDQVRGISGFFNQVQESLDGLKTLQQKCPKLALRFSSVMMPQNLPHVETLDEFARKNEIPIFYSPVVIAGTYYNNLHGAENLSLYGSSTQGAAMKFFEKLSREEETSVRYYYKDMVGMVQGKPRSRRCMMGFYGFVLEHDGNIYPCVNCERVSFGNLLTDSFDDIWFHGNSDEVRKQLRSSCCPTCPSMCFTAPINAGETIDYAWRRRIKPHLSDDSPIKP